MTSVRYHPPAITHMRDGHSGMSSEQEDETIPEVTKTNAHNKIRVVISWLISSVKMRFHMTPGYSMMMLKRSGNLWEVSLIEVYDIRAPNKPSVSAMDVRRQAGTNLSGN